jgi:VIT1/CCC1 family predicted Fe2+/Mn2+ transporter
MDAAFITIVQKLVSEQGKEAILNAAKAKALLADYARGEYKKESRLLLQVLGTGCQNEIAVTSDIETVKKQIVRKLQDDEFIAEKFAIDAVDLLCLVLRSENKTPNVEPMGEAATKPKRKRKPKEAPQTQDEPEAETPSPTPPVQESQTQRKNRGSNPGLSIFVFFVILAFFTIVLIFVGEYSSTAAMVIVLVVVIGIPVFGVVMNHNSKKK